MDYSAEDSFKPICEFVREARGYIQDPLIDFVMGNESGDLDSVASSISYAYILQHDNRYTSTNDDKYLPIINMERKQIHSRKDLLLLFSQHNIDVADLIFLDDINPKIIRRLYLVDHNTLNPKQQSLAGAVVGIIDHHSDENALFPSLKLKDKVIASVGSTATLISEVAPLNREIALMLLAPILIDTANLTNPDKTTPRDSEAAHKLLKHLSDINQTEFYKNFLEAKSDTTGLTEYELMRRDFKSYVEGTFHYGISTIPSKALWKEDQAVQLLPTLETFSADEKISLLILLMENPNPNGPKRKVLVYNRSEKQLEKAANHFSSDPILKDILIPSRHTKIPNVRFYSTEKLIPRKELQPLLNFPKNW